MEASDGGAPPSQIERAANLTEHEYSGRQRSDDAKAGDEASDGNRRQNPIRHRQLPRVWHGGRHPG
jgi:hypothetical protein